mgnify:CR=1 FL=1
MTTENNLTIRDKEQMIVGTILYCNRMIRSLNESMSRDAHITKLFESDNVHYAFVELASKITGESMRSMNEHTDKFIEDTNFVAMNEHHNYYAYLRKVREFLNGFEPDIQNSLNESMTFYVPEPKPLGKGKEIDIRQTLGLSETGNVNVSDTGALVQNRKTDIESFKEKLNAYIYELEKIDDTNKYSDDILRIKIFANQPLYIKGFNIVNSIVFQRELSEKFNKNISELLAVWFDKSLKRLMFIFPSDVITYRIENDELIRPQQSLRFTAENYIPVLQENVTHNYLVLWQNISDVKFTDNLYRDLTASKFRQEVQSQTQFVKGV